jgi:hypothetical protein
VTIQGIYGLDNAGNFLVDTGWSPVVTKDYLYLMAPK